MTNVFGMKYIQLIVNFSINIYATYKQYTFAFNYRLSLPY